MINLKARQKYVNFTYIKNAILRCVNFGFLIFGLVVSILCITNGNTSLYVPLTAFTILASILLVVNGFFILFSSIYTNKLRKTTIYEFFEIVDRTKIIGSPRVVYAYTCHNDFIEARLLQNSLQSYKNIEIWVSDGSDNENISNEIREKTLKHGFKYFKVGPTGSKNKSENLNAFLSKSGVNFDYLLITDSDEALDTHFVEYALKCFSSPKFRNLGYVTPLNYFYDGASLYTNAMLNQVNNFCWKNDFNKTFTINKISNLYSASCLLSRKLLDKVDNQFPSGCLEDYFLEYESLIRGFSGIILPITPAGQAFDKSVYATFNRNFRIMDWQICLFKSDVFKSYNEKYPDWYNFITNVVFSVPFAILGILIAPWILWLLIVNINELISSSYFIVLICSAIVLFICFIISLTIGTSKKTTLNAYGHLGWIFSAMYGLACLKDLSKHWFNAVFKSKYSVFISSGSFNGNNRKAWPIVVSLITSSLLIIGFVLLFVFLNLFANKWFIILFLYLIIIFGIVFLSSLSLLILHWASNKIVNPKFSMNDWVKPRDFYKFEKIKQNYEQDKKGAEHD